MKWKKGRSVSFSIPKNTKEIILYRPMIIYKKGEKKPKVLSAEDINSMLKIL